MKLVSRYNVKSNSFEIGYWKGTSFVVVQIQKAHQYLTSFKQRKNKMNSNYRENSLSPSVIKAMTVSGSIGLNLLDVCAGAFYQDEQQYQEWVAEWKLAYEAISKDSARFKQLNREHGEQGNSERQEVLAILSKFANTLLNARQYAKDQRKIVRDAAFEASKVAENA